jgi:hypothetical protein
MTERLELAKEILRQAQIDLQAFMSGEGGAAIKSYKDGFEKVRDLVYDGQSHPSGRMFDGDVRKSYGWLFKLQIETAPYRVKAKRLKDAVKTAEQHVRALEREVKR